MRAASFAKAVPALGKWFLLGITAITLSGCFSGVWTGANLVYTRHNVYKKIDDFALSTKANLTLFSDKSLKQKECYLDMAVFNGDLLLAGHVPDESYKALIEERLKDISGSRKLFQYVSLDNTINNGMNDTWITTKIRSRMIADSSIDPSVFKIITVDGIVYIMGDVEKKQAERVIDISRNTNGVVRVVKLMKYYELVA